MLMAAAADADPDWTWDISTQDGMIVETLRARHANAALLSPVELNAAWGPMAMLTVTAYPVLVNNYLVGDFGIPASPGRAAHVLAALRAAPQ